jgi:hypothetical protein
MNYGTGGAQLERQAHNDNRRPRTIADERFRMMWMALLLMSLVTIATVLAG